MLQVNGAFPGPRIAVLGGGISGLATAFWLSELLPTAEVSLIESQEKCGGVIGTWVKEGSLLEAGPLAFPIGAPATGELLRKSKVVSRCIPASPARSIGLWDGKRLLPFPRSPWTFLSSRLLSPQGFIRLLAEPFIPRAKHSDDETVLKFFRRRTGQEFLECFLEPFVVGILSGDPSTLSMSSNLPAFHAMEKKFGSLAFGFCKKLMDAWFYNKQNRTSVSEMVTTEVGSQGIIAGLVENLVERKVRILLSHKVTSVVRNERYVVTWEHKSSPASEKFDGLVSCLPAYALASLCPTWPPAYCEFLRNIPHGPLVLSYLAFRKSQSSKKFKGDGFLVQSKAGEGILSAFFPSRMASNRSLADVELIRVMLGGARRPEIGTMDEEDIQALSSQAIQKIISPLGELKSFPVIKHNRGLPQMLVGHEQKTNEAKAWLKDRMPGFALAGTSFHGAGIENAIASGKQAARDLSSFFQK